MPKKPAERTNAIIIGIIVVGVVLVAALTGLKIFRNPASKTGAQKKIENIQIPPKTGPVIDYNKLKQDKKLQALMQKRKKQYGLKTGVDIITKSNESFKIGDETVSMQEILDKIRLKSGDIVEMDLKSRGKSKKEKIESFGIHVVQPGENIWNIHFRFLKDYFDHKGIQLSPMSDEPLKGGRSSGIGKILKFSEHTVNIYNIREHKLDKNLNLIFPLTKVVVYNMDQIFKFLDLIDYKHVNRIQFDGETLWMPAK
jgi:cell division protein FtsI/penicillin-binding protein 2